MATPVIKVARQGYDITTADPRYLTLDSSRSQFKVYEKGSGTVAFSAKSLGNTYQKKYVDITHNLGYQPSFIAQLKGPSGGWKVHPVLNNGSTGPTKWCSGIDRLDENTIRLYVYVYDPTLAAYSAFNVSYEYLIFVDPNKNVWV